MGLKGKPFFCLDMQRLLVAAETAGAQGICNMFIVKNEPRAHQGRVRCIFAKNGKVYTSGGSSRLCSSIKVWDDTGEALGNRHCSHYGEGLSTGDDVGSLFIGVSNLHQSKLYFKVAPLCCNHCQL